MYVYFWFWSISWLSADILLARSIYFAMFENNNATFYGNPLCAVDDDLLLLPVLSVILKMYITVVYTPRSHFQSPTLQNITHVKFTSVLHRRTMSVVAKPDTSIWQPKPEIITSLELRHQIRDFRWRRTGYKISHIMIATTIDYQKLQRWRTKGLYCHFRLSVVVAIAQSQFLRSGRGQKPQICRRNFLPLCHISWDISISGFGGHIAISRCRSLSHSVAY